VQNWATTPDSKVRHLSEAVVVGTYLHPPSPSSIEYWIWKPIEAMAMKGWKNNMKHEARESR